MNGFLKGLIAAAMLAVAPMTASALTTTIEGGVAGGDLTPFTAPTNLFANSGASLSYGVVFGDAFDIRVNNVGTGNGNFTLNFTQATAPSVLTISAISLASQFHDLSVSFNGGPVIDMIVNGSIVGDNIKFGGMLPVSVAFVWNSISKNADIDLNITALPIPAPLALLLVGLAGVGYAARRKQLAAAA